MLYTDSIISSIAFEKIGLSRLVSYPLKCALAIPSGRHFSRYFMTLKVKDTFPIVFNLTTQCVYSRYIQVNIPVFISHLDYFTKMWE